RLTRTSTMAPGWGPEEDGHEQATRTDVRTDDRTRNGGLHARRERRGWGLVLGEDLLHAEAQLHLHRAGGSGLRHGWQDLPERLLGQRRLRAGRRPRRVQGRVDRAL